MARLKTKVKEQLPDDVFERVKIYRKRTIDYYHKLDSLARIHLPEKCIECYESGILFCRFWVTGDVCEDMDFADKLRRVGLL